MLHFANLKAAFHFFFMYTLLKILLLLLITAIIELVIEYIRMMLRGESTSVAPKGQEAL